MIWFDSFFSRFLTRSLVRPESHYTHKSCVITFINTPIIVTHSRFSVCCFTFLFSHFFLKKNIYLFGNVCSTTTMCSLCLVLVFYAFIFFLFNIGQLIVGLNDIHCVLLSKIGTPQLIHSIVREWAKKKTITICQLISAAEAKKH